MSSHLDLKSPYNSIIIGGLLYYHTQKILPAGLPMHRHRAIAGIYVILILAVIADNGEIWIEKFDLRVLDPKTEIV